MHKLQALTKIGRKLLLAVVIVGALMNLARTGIALAPEETDETFV
jgi:hypothetical protein